jgi:hypothetical protein
MASRRGLPQPRTELKRSLYAILEWENSREDGCPMSWVPQTRQNESLK